MTHDFSVPYARTNAYYYSFSQRMLRFWNSLPPTVAHAPSSSVFKRLIEFYVLRFMYYISYVTSWITAVYAEIFLL